MKINIGKYITYFGPFQIAEKILFWMDKDADSVHKFGKWLAETPLNGLCEWVNTKRQRKVSVRIDRSDTWSMDTTLAKIILPMLIQLKAKKHGSPYTNDEDIPAGLGLRSSEAIANEDDPFIDGNFHRRWDWVMDEMIWAFTQINDDDNDEQFHVGNDEQFHVGKFRIDAYREHQARITRGTTLFGKYFRGLWD